MTACHKLNDLKDLLLELYPEATYEYIDNPRAEKVANSLKVKNDNFKQIGHSSAIDINHDDIRKLVQICKDNRNRFESNKEYVKPISFWKKI